MSESSFIQIPFEVLHYVRKCNLTATQYSLWLYLYELEPYGQKWIDLDINDAAKELNVDPLTIKRAVKRLEDLALFHFEPKAWRIRNTVEQEYTGLFFSRRSDLSDDRKIFLSSERSFDHQKDLSVTEKERFDKGSSDLYNNKQEIVRKTINNVPAPRPVENFDRESSTTVLDTVVEAGFQPNKTIRKMVSEYPPDRIKTALRAAIEYLDKLEKPLQKQPEAILTKAIVQGWRPRNNSQKSKTPTGFDEWFNAAKSVRVVEASRMEGDRLMVLTPSGWQTYEEVSAAFTLRKLQDMNTQLNGLTR
ncbi:hypothetical protein [Egbenema bharatensis]|uniref:hypothetical protein n=1 Tax=Egbenema bharatensis TaxID=3463334 RepID=UPI003A84D07D